jgi:uncharacterized repeat protein (TIGR01451 family)
VAVSPDGSTAYVTNYSGGGVWVISTATDTVTAMIPPNTQPRGVAVSPDGSTAYVANEGNGNVSVISTASNTVTGTIPASVEPWAVAVSQDGGTVYVTNNGSADVSVISTATNTVTGTIPVGDGPAAVAATIVPLAPSGAPSITAVNPASGPQAGGTRVTITGNRFTGATAVHFGAIPAARFTVDSATRITATAPAAASAGTVNVAVTNQAGTSPATLASKYTYQPTPNRADVSAALSCPRAITAGHHGTCTLTVANAGPATAANVTASVLLPANLRTVSCAPGCTRDPATATWTLALPSGAKGTFTVTVRACAPGRVTVLAEATDPVPDPDPFNNAATARVSITRHRR